MINYKKLLLPTNGKAGGGFMNYVKLGILALLAASNLMRANDNCNEKCDKAYNNCKATNFASPFASSCELFLTDCEKKCLLGSV